MKTLSKLISVTSWPKSDCTLLKVKDTPAVKIMLEYKLADLWIGVFYKKLPIYDVSTPEGLRYFTDKQFNKVPVKYSYLHIWICVIPCLPVHIIRKIK